MVFLRIFSIIFMASMGLVPLSARKDTNILRADNFNADKEVAFSMVSDPTEAHNSYYDEFVYLNANPGSMGKSMLARLGYLVANEEMMPNLYSTVKNLSDKLGINTPLILIFKGSLLSLIPEHCGVDFRCNASAMSVYHNLGLICIGDDLIKGLSDGELEAIIAHELGHINHNHLLKRLMFGPIIYLLTNLFLLEPLYYLGVFNLLGSSAYWALATSGVYLLSRTQEKEADLCAAKIIDDPCQISKALYKLEIIYREKSHAIMDFIDTFTSTHPLTKNRKKYIAQAAFEKEAAFIKAIDKHDYVAPAAAA